MALHVIPSSQRLSHTSQTHVSGHRRTQFDGKKILTLWTLICGAVAVLLWGFFSFPRKFVVTRLVKNKTCDGENMICMSAWNKVNQNCFFLFHHKNTWISAEEHCIIYHGHLAKFNTKSELDIFLSHVKKGQSSYWIGLNKRNSRGIWVWTDGTKYNNVARIQDHGECAFMQKNGIDSTNCDDLRDFICIKPSLCL
ncbi:C-type lectin domain family 2 member G-like [Psammomys obesus]|uniref:C-type lectin domain family 2 member G-like n=1 Tax=Psammomys obesus TaxID=48139 RepID=UPI0024531209|nr:C-type lectin domain family 2 member G-like [Psammomys obesus]